jgi:hypothetical protein
MNLELLERSARPGRRASPGDYVFVFAITALFGAVIFSLMIATMWVAVSLWAVMTS